MDFNNYDGGWWFRGLGLLALAGAAWVAYGVIRLFLLLFKLIHWIN